MPIDPIPRALYPLVPKAPGVPAVLRAAATLADTVTLGYLGLSDSLNNLIGSEPVKWGVFDSNGAPIADYDSFISLDYQNQASISKYPVELGGFNSYNKVESPYDILVILSCAGSEDRRATFQSKIEAARKSLQLYSVFSPTKTYPNVNITTVAIRQELTEGANVTRAILSCEEVRQRAQADYSSPLNTLDNGQVQTVDDPTIDTSGVV